MSPNFLNKWPWDALYETMHFFKGPNGVSLFLEVCEFTVCPFGGNGTSEITFLNKENIGEGFHTVTVVENYLPPTTVLENDLPPTSKKFKLTN